MILKLLKQLFCSHTDGLFYKDYNKGTLVMRCTKCKRETTKRKDYKYPSVWYTLWEHQQ